jgi:hypothetical protein
MSNHPFEYAVLRVVPRVERGEMINAGVLLYCPDLDFLGARVQLDPERLRAVDPTADVEHIQAVLQGFAHTCAADGNGGAADAAAAEPLGKRFRWLTAPRSTVVQPGPVHTGLTNDPAAELEHLLDVLVG